MPLYRLFQVHMSSFNLRYIQETDYEVILGDFLQRYPIDYLPITFDIIMHLKRVQSDLCPITKLIQNPEVPPQIKYVLTRALLPEMQGDGDEPLALGGFERAIIKETAETIIASFGELPRNGARSVLSKYKAIETSNAMQVDTKIERIDELIEEDTSEMCTSTLSQIRLDTSSCSCCGFTYNVYDEDEDPIEFKERVNIFPVLFKVLC